MSEPRPVPTGIDARGPQKPEWLAEIFPWPLRNAIVNGRRMSYVDEGPADGPPVIMCPGNPTWSFLYRDFIPVLTAAGYRAVVVDWIGSGYSERPHYDAALTLPHHIADLTALIDQLDLIGYTIVGQDWGGPQGFGAALQRAERLRALVLMNTWLFTDYVGKFHQATLPWMTWHSPLMGQFLMKRHKVLSHNGPAAITVRGLSDAEARAYHHVFDDGESDRVVLTWPRTIPLHEGDRGWQDMQTLQRRIPELAHIPTLLLWAPGDNVFPIEYANRLKELIPHAEGPIEFDRASHFLQDDRGPDLVIAIRDFLDRLGEEAS